MTPTPTLTVSAAISAVEANQAAYNNTVTTTDNDKANAAAIQAKLDAANAQVASDQAAQADAATKFNASLDDAIDAFKAAKIPIAPPVVGA